MRNTMPICAGLSIALLGCSSHPLVEDFARKDTFNIVESIRCEAQRGIANANIPAEKLALTKIGFDFSFDISESNKATSGKLDFANPFTGGKFSLALSGGVDKQRKGERSFRVVEDLSSLKANTKCANEPSGNRLLYPITGEIGMEEVISTFWKLNANSNWDPHDSGAVPKVFSDTLTFTTTLNAGISPSIELGAGGGNFKLTHASLDGSAERKDEHKVVIAIATVATPKADGGAKLSTYGRAFPALQNGSLPRDKTGADNVILELDRIRNRDDDRRTLEDLRLLTTP